MQEHHQTEVPVSLTEADHLLILSASTGTGHNAAAKAVKKEWEARGGRATIKESLEFLRRGEQRLATVGYEKIILYTPKGFGLLYQAGNLYDKTTLTSPTHYINAKASIRLLRYMNQHHFTAVLCTHLFPMESLSYLIEEDLLDIPTFSVMTDYTILPFYRKTNLDYYFLSNPYDIPRFLEAGFDEDQLIPSGIPVDTKFNQAIDKVTARKVLDLLPPHYEPKPTEPLAPLFLIMTGGMGYGHPLEIARDLLIMAPNAQIVLLAGTNRTLKRTANRMFAHEPGVRTIDFTDKVHLYFAAADVLLTKPGGLSSTEAATSRIPLVLTKPIPGLETYNQKFFVQHGCALAGNTSKKAAERAIFLYKHPQLSKRMMDCQAHEVKGNATASIVQKMASVLREREGAAEGSGKGVGDGTGQVSQEGVTRKDTD